MLGIEPAWLLTLIAALLATGAVAGMTAGLLGLGGGIVIVPVLYYVFALVGVDEAVRMHCAVGTSLATIIPTGLSSARAHRSHGNLDTGLLRQLAPGVVAGVSAATAVSYFLTGRGLTIFFAVVALAVAANMAFNRRGLTLGDQLPAGWMPRLGLGGIIGSVSALMGIGGGTLSIPILTAFGTPVRRAVGTAAAIGVVISVPGAIGFAVSGLGTPGRPPLSLGYVNLPGFACIVPMTVLMAPVGARLAQATNPARLRQLFALFLAMTAARLLVTNLGG
jgi:uncharacterized membrane protein YfcA